LGGFEVERAYLGKFLFDDVNGSAHQIFNFDDRGSTLLGGLFDVSEHINNPRQAIEGLFWIKYHSAVIVLNVDFFDKNRHIPVPPQSHPRKSN
jgi:hypothetical protein